MSEDYEHVDAQMAQMAQAFVGLAGTAQGAMMGAFDHFEYRHVALEDLNAHGADRWRVVAIPPSQEIKQGLAGITPGPLMFLMERQVIAPDSPAEAGELRVIDYNGYFPDTGGMR